MAISTSDFSDICNDNLQYLDSIFKSYGKKTRFSGLITTIKCFEDVLSIKNEISTNGKGKILIIDGGSSQNSSLFDEILSKEAINNKWEGIIVSGNIRNSNKIRDLNIGIKALGESVKRSPEKYEGEKNIDIEIAGVRVKDGDIVVADEDGIVIFEKKNAREIKANL